MKKLFVCVAVALLAAGCNSEDGGGSPTDPSQVNIEFSFSDLVVGTGAEAVVGTRATLANWEVWLYNAAGTASKGTSIQDQNSILQGAPVVGPITFVHRVRESHSRVRSGRARHEVGGKRRIYVPSSLAYGSRGSGAIPPNAALVFESRTDERSIEQTNRRSGDRRSGVDLLSLRQITMLSRMIGTARFALITTLFVSGCGGAQEPPAQQPSSGTADTGRGTCTGAGARGTAFHLRAASANRYGG